MSDFEEDDDFIPPEEDFEDDPENEFADDVDDDGNEFVDRQLTVITEEKDDGFEEEELMNDELRDDDISQYEEVIEELTEFAGGTNPYKTSRFLNKFEYPRIVSTRATQLQYGAEPKVPVNDPKTGRKLSLLEIAEEELRVGKLPLVVLRPVPTKIPHKYIFETRPMNTLIR